MVMSTKTKPISAALLALSLAFTAASGCANYDAPPEVSIAGIAEGKLFDNKAPIVIEFDKKPVASSIKLSVAPYHIDEEGRLRDEDEDDGTSLDPWFTHDPVAGDTGGTAELSADGKSMTITLDHKLPLGASIVLVIEPGLSNEAGVTSTERRRLIFSYSTGLTCAEPVSVFKSGAYFFLASIVNPVPIQVSLFARIEVDPATGATRTKFTKARRNPDPNRCPTPCETGQVCRLLPAPQCVLPSVPAGSVDEFSDYVPNPDPPTGFGFAVEACVVDQSASTTYFNTTKVDVEVMQPHVTLSDTELTAQFTVDAEGVLRGTGALTAAAVMLGVIDSGAGNGEVTARGLTDEEAPPDIPAPE